MPSLAYQIRRSWWVRSPGQVVDLTYCMLRNELQLSLCFFLSSFVAPSKSTKQDTNKKLQDYNFKVGAQTRCMSESNWILITYSCDSSAKKLLIVKKVTHPCYNMPYRVQHSTHLSAFLLLCTFWSRVTMFLCLVCRQARVRGGVKMRAAEWRERRPLLLVLRSIQLKYLPLPCTPVLSPSITANSNIVGVVVRRLDI